MISVLFLPSSTKRQKKKTLSELGPPLTKLLGSVHVYCGDSVMYYTFGVASIVFVFWGFFWVWLLVLCLVLLSSELIALLNCVRLPCDCQCSSVSLPRGAVGCTCCASALCVGSLFCRVVLSALSSFVFIFLRKRELVVLLH